MELPEGAKAYDNSMLDKYRACPRSFLYRHVFHWTPEEKSHDLIFGSCWHAAMDVVWAKAADSKISDAELVTMAMVAFLEEWLKYYPLETESVFSGETEDARFPKMPGRAKDMVSHYVRRRRPYLKTLEIVGIEVPFLVPLPQFDSTFYIGRKDKIVRCERGIVDVDHKTSKTDGEVWSNTFFPNSQMDGYLYAGYLNYEKDYWGIEIDGALVQKGTPRSAREDFPPGIGFMQVPIQRQLSFVESWLWDTQYLIMQIEAHFKMYEECKPTDDYLRAFEKHTTGCGYYRGCEYRDLCKFYENPMKLLPEAPRGFIVDQWTPFDAVDILKRVVEE